MRKIILMAAIWSFSVHSKAYDFMVDGIYYDLLSAKTCEVVKGEGYASECITIPKTVTFAGEDYEVVGIGADAFYNQTSIKTVYIPASISEIGIETFMHCYGLTSIVVDDLNPIYSSYEGALFNKSRSKLILVPSGKAEYSIPNNVKKIGENAFYLCKSLKRIFIPMGVTSIDANAFAGCDSLITIEIPNSVEHIGEYAFCGCKALTTIRIPNSVTEIGRFAFSYCTSLKAVFFAPTSTIKGIPNGLFCGCTSLKSVTISSGIISLGDYSFSQCDSLRTIVIPNTVSSLGNDVFFYCQSLRKLELPESIETIGNHAFEYCQQLDTIALPKKVNKIGEGVFNGCRGLSYISVSLDNTKYKSYHGALYDNQMNCLIKVPALATSDSIPSTVTRISPYAYFLCDSLTKVIIPESVAEVGKWAFVECISLDSVYMIKPVDLSETYLPKDTRILYVPAGKKADFEGSCFYLEQYSQFKRIEEYGVTPTAITLQEKDETKIGTPVIYSLLGVRIGGRNYLSKGVYIVNGKKVVFK